MQFRAGAGFGENGQIGADAVGALLHADEAEAAAESADVRVEAVAIILDHQFDHVPREVELDTDFISAGVLHSVCESFLGDAQQIGLYVGGHGLRLAHNGERDIHRGLSRELADQALERARNIAAAEQFGAQALDGTACFRKAGARQRCGGIEVGFHFRIGAVDDLLGGLELEKDASKVLGERIMDIARHAISLFGDGRLAGLLGQQGQLQSERGLLSQALGQFQFHKVKLTEFREADDDRTNRLFAQDQRDAEEPLDPLLLQISAAGGIERGTAFDLVPDGAPMAEDGEGEQILPVKIDAFARETVAGFRAWEETSIAVEKMEEDGLRVAILQPDSGSRAAENLGDDAQDVSENMININFGG